MLRPTSKDVAREAGVSQATVSFVLNNRTEQSITPATRALVLDAVRKLGYVPSAAARSLRLGHSAVVVCLYPEMPVSEAAEIFKRELGDRLAAVGFTCVFHHQSAHSGALDGLWEHLNPACVISVGALPATETDALRRAGIPLIDKVFWPENAQLLGLDQSNIGRLQVDHLHSRGHRRIGIATVDDPRDEAITKPRLAGARDEAIRLGLPEPSVATLDYDDLDSAEHALQQWRASDGRVSGVAAFNDRAALMILAACDRLSVHVPDDLAVIGADDLPFSLLSRPPLSSVAMNLSVPAHRLAAHVVDLIKGRTDTPDPESAYAPVLRVIERAST
jgi:DNA-binding LacI/PurR family transcriptional regulator